MNPGQRFVVRRDDLTQTRIESFDIDATPLAAGQVRVRIEHFAFTANNITYAVFGDSMHYWRFFPAAEGWGCIPVWGFATVEASAYEGLATGERLYGYWPMASHALLQPGDIGANSFSDVSAQRAELPAVYNRYMRVARAMDDHAAREGEYAVLKPLFATAWLIDDFMHEATDFGARTLLLSSASSKTAYSTAFCLERRAGRTARVVGATSPTRLGFARSLGLYDEVIAYDAVTSMARDETAAYIDFAGDASFRRAVHEHWRDTLTHSCSVGGTHHAALGSGAGLPGPRPQLFFAPARIAKRSAPPPEGFGRAGLMQQIDEAFGEFIAHATASTEPWITIDHRQGDFESVFSGGDLERHFLPQA